MAPFRSFFLALSISLAAMCSGGARADDFQAAQEAYRTGDVRTAISLLRKSAEAGHGQSQALLGEILDKADHNEDAVRYFRMAADQGLPDGFFGLAVMYASGEGVGRDLAVARQWMLRAAQSGHRQAIQTLALSYMNGGLGLTDADRRSPEALAWIEKAAAMDSTAAIDRLAVAYRQGQLGLAPDVKSAEELEARSRSLRRIAAPKTGKKGKANG